MKAEFNDAASLGAMLEQMTTEELRSLLDRELHTEPVNEDAIRLIRRILRRRSQNAPVTITPELERAWEKYQKDSCVSSGSGGGKPLGDSDQMDGSGGGIIPSGQTIPACSRCMIL